MLYSMTGYGQEQYEADDISFIVEIKTLNNRYLKTTIRLPELFSYAEIEIDRLIKRAVSRGTVNYILHVKQAGQSNALSVDQTAVLSYLKSLDQAVSFAGRLNVNLTVDMASILPLYGACQPREYSPEDNERLLKIIQETTARALGKLQAMRAEEGRALLADLEGNCAAVAQNLKALGQLTGTVVLNYRDRLLQRTNELLSGVNMKLTQEDIIKEVSVFAERCDINEEISRLSSHLEQFRKICQDEDEAGRKLDFLTQEMLREANTIASKANDARISQHVVDIKVAIDRLREQVQNIE